MTNMWLQKWNGILQIHKCFLPDAPALVLLPRGREGCACWQGRRAPWSTGVGLTAGGAALDHGMQPFPVSGALSLASGVSWQPSKHIDLFCSPCHVTRLRRRSDKPPSSRAFRKDLLPLVKGQHPPHITPQKASMFLSNILFYLILSNLELFQIIRTWFLKSMCTL